MRIALCQTNPTVGDFDRNVAGILRAAALAAEGGARVAVFPELAVCAYPARDLFDRPAFVQDARRATEQLAAAAPRDLLLLVGTIESRGDAPGRPLHDAVAVVRQGRVERFVRKRLLPTYDVFDEDRYFEPAGAQDLVEVDGVRLGVTVCEDVWNDVPFDERSRRYAHNPVADVVAAGADVIVSVSASPFGLHKRRGRPRMLSAVARAHARPLVYVNLVGGHDDLVFDGASALFGPDGEVRAQAAHFREQVVVAELERGGEVHDAPDTDEGAALDALVLGVRDYFDKCGFERAVLGLSGGIDSALVACIGAEALGRDRVLAVAMPTRYSSDHSLEDARALADALGIQLDEVPIDAMFQAYLDGLEGPLARLGAAGPQDVTFENVQARIRGNVLMAMANRDRALLLATGNKSEVAVGYCTLYGDMCGALAVIGDLYKTAVYRVAREHDRRKGVAVIPERTFTKPPSAELRPDQRDQDTLPPYDVLDPILEAYVEQARDPEEITAAGFEEATVRRVTRMVRASEHKRFQMPPAIKLGPKAFGTGRRYPIAQRWKG